MHAARVHDAHALGHSAGNTHREHDHERRHVGDGEAAALKSFLALDAAQECAFTDSSASEARARLLARRRAAPVSTATFDD